jgi:hypothetical protein
MKQTLPASLLIATALLAGCATHRCPPPVQIRPAVQVDPQLLHPARSPKAREDLMRLMPPSTDTTQPAGPTPRS